MIRWIVTPCLLAALLAAVLVPARSATAYDDKSTLMGPEVGKPECIKFDGSSGINQACLFKFSDNTKCVVSLANLEIKNGENISASNATALQCQFK